jgi:hypothetical protein
MKPEAQIIPTGSRNQSKPLSAASATSLARPRIMLVSRLLLNDQLWCQGDVVVVEGGRPKQLTPRFQLQADPPLQSGEVPLTRD